MLDSRKEANASRGHQKDRSVGDLVFGDCLECGFDQRLEMIWANLGGTFGKGRNARSNFSAGFEDELGEAAEVIGRGVLAGLSGVPPFVHI